jgi:expansin (peptidoglycan-binding protein)
MEGKRFYEVLGPLLEGWTITGVEKGTVSEGDPAKITATKGAQNLSFEVFGGVYGPVVTNVQKGTALAYTGVGYMLDAITEHVLALENEKVPEENPDYLEAVDDPFTRRLGFRCRETGTEWWTSLTALKESPYRMKFATVESRKALALELSKGLGVKIDPPRA